MSNAKLDKNLATIMQLADAYAIETANIHADSLELMDDSGPECCLAGREREALRAAIQEMAATECKP